MVCFAGKVLEIIICFVFESFSPKNLLDIIIPKQMKTNIMSHWMLFAAYSFMNEWLYISQVLMCMQIITKCHYYILAEYQQISVYGFM